ISTRCTFMSKRPSSNTANSPHGPAPIISTSVLIASLMSASFRLNWAERLRLSSQRCGNRKAIIWRAWLPQPLAVIRQLGCNGVKHSEMARERSLAPRRDPASGGFSLSSVGQCALCRPRPQPARQQCGLRDLFRARPRHADEGPQLRADAGGRHLDHGPARHAFSRRTALAGNHRNGARRGQVRPDIRDLRSGGVFRRHLRRIGAVGVGAARRGDTQADGADGRHPQEFPALDSPRDRPEMMRAARLTILIVCAALQPAAADPFYREDLRIAAAAAGPRGLEAMLLRPAGTRRYPLALISHGTPRDATERAGMSPYGSYRQALEFARRGFAALVVMRRGYGDSGGDYAENNGPCGQRDYSLAAKASVSDLRTAIEAMRGRTDVSTSGMIAVGASAGGFATVALTADPPAGLAAAISFAGGRGSRADNDVCDEDALVREFGALGRTSRIPMLWIYA